MSHADLANLADFFELNESLFLFFSSVTGDINHIFLFLVIINRPILGLFKAQFRGLFALFSI